MFWDTTLICVESWVEDHFQTRSGVELLSRQVVLGPEALKNVDSYIPFIFRRRKFSGMCFIGFNRSLAEAFAAKRLNENQDNFSEVSSIFLGLICESATCALWESLAFKLLGENLDAPQPSATEFGAGNPLTPQETIRWAFGPSACQRSPPVNLFVCDFTSVFLAWLEEDC